MSRCHGSRPEGEAAPDLEGVVELFRAGALAEELGLMAGWLGLDEVRVSRRGDLAPALAGALPGGASPRSASTRSARRA